MKNNLWFQKLCTILHIISLLKHKCECVNGNLNKYKVYREASILYLFQHTLFLMFPIFQKYLNPQVRTNKLVNSVVYHPCPLKLASGMHPYFFKLLRVLSLSRMLVELSLTCIFHHVC